MAAAAPALAPRPGVPAVPMQVQQPYPAVLAAPAQQQVRPSVWLAPQRQAPQPLGSLRLPAGVLPPSTAPVLVRQQVAAAPPVRQLPQMQATLVPSQPMQLQASVPAAPLLQAPTVQAQPTAPPVAASTQMPEEWVPPLKPGKVLVASFDFDGERREVRYGPGEEFESPADFFAPCHSEWRLPYEAMLECLSARGWLDDLPLDAQGILRLALPFCGSVQELPVLVEFLGEHFVGRPGINGVHIFGSDVQNWDLKGGYWRQKEKWAGRKYKGALQLQFRPVDLTREAHPNSALTFGIHPECTAPNSPWPQILTNIIQNTSGVCMIACFKEGEMEVVCDICQKAGAACEVIENPHWQRNPVPPGTQPPFLRFLVLVRRGVAQAGAGTGKMARAS